MLHSQRIQRSSKKFTFVELDIRQTSVKADYRMMQEARYIEIHVIKIILYLIFKFRHVKTNKLIFEKNQNSTSQNFIIMLHLYD